ncbi:MAG: iron dependent repressor, metal binding and dimerization domain protein [Parachlamydiaceae bacterium]
MISKLPISVPFIATRNHHLNESIEDYVEMIQDLLIQKGEVRICDLAEQLGVSHVTVIRALERFSKKGYLTYRRNQPIRLTAKGEKLAISSKKRHQFLLTYLMALGVSEETALIDVEGMEHHVSLETLQAMERHLALLKGDEVKP